MKLKDIVFDIDGTLTSDQDFIIDLLKEYDPTRLQVIDSTAHDLLGARGFTREECYTFFQIMGDRFLLNTPLREGVPELFNLLHRNNVRIHIVSARSAKCHGKCVYETTKQYFKKHNLVYDTLILTEDKLKYMKENGITVIVDDNNYTFPSIYNNVTYFKMLTENNADISADYTVSDIYELICILTALYDLE